MLDCLSKEFAIKRGVEQEDPMSPTLFNAVLEDIFHELTPKWKSGCRGLDVGSLRGERLTNLRFADDVVLFASSLSEARHMLEDLVKASITRGLVIHPKKTKITSNCSDQKRPNSSREVEVAGHQIEVLPLDGQTKYLGRAVCSKNFMAAEIENRIATGWKKFFALRDILCNKSYPLAKRVKLFDTAITPSILYASGSWTMMTVEFESRLRKTQRRMLRTIYQKGRLRQKRDDRTQSSSRLDEVELAPEEDDDLEPWPEFMKRVTREIEHHMDKLHIEDWVKLQRRRKCTWASHVARRSDDRWSTTLLAWQPEGGPRQGGKGRGRKQARPCQRWEDALCDSFGSYEFVSDWRLPAGDREEWNKLTMTFAESTLR